MADEEKKIEQEDISDPNSDKGQSESENEAFGKSELNCRFYGNEFPEVEDLVMVEISTVNEDGAYVKLLEYNDKEALILASNTTRKRVRNVKKLLRLGSLDVMQVISVEKEGGYIDLSKRTLQAAEVEQKKIDYEKAKQVHLILRLTAFQLQVPLIDLYEQFGFKLYDQFEHAYDAIKLCLSEPDRVLPKLNTDDKTKEALVFNIHKKMAAQPTKLRSTFDLQCFTYQGIDAIREALLEAKKQTSDEKFEMVFQLIAPPEYKCEVVTLDKVGGTKRIEDAIAIIEAEIKKRNGTFKLKTKVTTIGTRRDLTDEIVVLDQDEEANSSDEDNQDGMDVDLENDDDLIQEDDGEEEQKN